MGVLWGRGRVAGGSGGPGGVVKMLELQVEFSSSWVFLSLRVYSYSSRTSFFCFSEGARGGRS